MRATAQQLRAFVHFRPDHQVKGRTAMQAACNRTKGAHPFDFDVSSMEAQAHTSCNRRAGYYVRETAPPTIPQPSNNDLLTVGINRYSNVLSVAIELYRLTLSDAVSGVGINV